VLPTGRLASAHALDAWSTASTTTAIATAIHRARRVQDCVGAPWLPVEPG